MRGKIEHIGLHLAQTGERGGIQCIVASTALVSVLSQCLHLGTSKVSQ